MFQVKDGGENLWHKQGQREERLNHGTKGAHLCIPFQCELCWLRNLEGRNPRPGGLDDVYLMCLRRANLDAFSGRAKLTIEKHLLETSIVVRNCGDIGRTPPFPPRGPMPVSDAVGMGVAVDMLMRSITAKGRIGKHIQYESMRKVRATYTKSWDSSPLGISEGSSFAQAPVKFG